MNHVPVVFRFRLYIAGESPNSIQAIFNLDALCRAHLEDRHQVEIVDVLLHPRRALADGVVLTPTLVRFAPEPVSRIVGTLADTRSLREAWGLVAPPS